MLDHAELNVRLRQQSLLVELGRCALTHVDFDALLHEACRLTAEGMNVRFAKVLEYNPALGRFLVRAGVGWHEGVVGHATIGADSQSPAGYALHTGTPVISNALEQEHRFHTPRLLIEHGVKRAANVIMLGEGRPYGVLEADSEVDGVFTAHDIDFLQGAANLLGLALEYRRSENELRRLNETLEQRVEHAIAERRAAEDALHQAQKMEALGQLTGGVAHDFNNLLMVISGNLELLSRADDAKAQSLIAAAQQATSRGAQLTSQLLAFARRQTLRPETRPINDLVREFESLISRILSEALRLTFVLDPAAGACDIDPAQFGSALLNLVINSRDAMPSGGEITVRTGVVALDQRQAAQHSDVAAGLYVTVAVSDTGLGMRPDVLARVAEPFYTTKEPGQGTGLGLSQVDGFVRQSGGFMTIDSAPGRGTTVRLHFPRNGAAASISTAATGASASGSGTVLVVEDDRDVRDLLLALLEDLGYSTVAAADGPEALGILRQCGKTIDVLLTDMVMPGGISGLELIRSARALLPGIPAILTSGYTAENIANNLPADVAVLPKPHQQEDLARAISEVLRDNLVCAPTFAPR